MKVHIHMESQSNPVVRENVLNTYVKEGLYCVYLENGTVYKYPIKSIFQITENP